MPVCYKHFPNAPLKPLEILRNDTGKAQGWVNFGTSLELLRKAVCRVEVSSK